MSFAPFLLAAACLCTLVVGNVEKTIFLGPESINVPATHPTLEDLKVDTLTPTEYSVRTHIYAEFPTEILPEGPATWLLLDELEEGRRYEVRICWIATQPTAFHLESFSIPHVFSTPGLISSLNNYSTSRQHLTTPSRHTSSQPAERQASVLLLRIQAAAEYFSSNKTLMEKVPPVYVDIILDPFLLNVLPRSLLPTVLYIVLLVSPASYLFGSKVIMPRLKALSRLEDEDELGSDSKKTR